MAAINDMFRGKMGQTKVKRYRPGKAPEWAHDFDEDGDITLEKESADHLLQKKDDDPRLRRLAESRMYNRNEVREDRRRIRQAEIVSTIEEESSRRQIEGSPDLFEEDEDAVEERRTKTREKSWLQREQEEVALMREEEEAEDETDSEEEEEEEEEVIVIAMSKPAFVHKSERHTIVERERLEAKERAQKEAVKKKVEERRVETKQILVGKIQEIRKKMELTANTNDDVDTNDDVNEAEEYAAWMVREIARIKRAREEAIKTVRNTMTEKERMECERRQPKQKRRRFLQKDYHRGSFFQTDPDDHAATAKTDSIYMRDFSAPTGEDKMDKTILPAVMQVKCFGRRGGTKWTHLVNEDTTLQHDIYSCLNGLMYRC